MTVPVENSSLASFDTTPAHTLGHQARRARRAHRLLSAQLQAATYHLLVMLRDFDSGGGWNGGFRSCAHWLNWRTGLELGAAREKVRVAHALAELPLLSAAMARGELSFSKVRALTRVATPANEEELLIFAKAGTAAHVEKVVRAWRRVDRLAERTHEQLRHAGRYLRAYTDEDGMVVVQARLAPEAGAALLRALDAAAVKLAGDVPRKRPTRTPAASGRARSSAAPTPSASSPRARSPAASTPAPRGDRYQVVLHVDAGALDGGGERGATLLDEGRAFPRKRRRRLACDCGMVGCGTSADGTVLDVGRRTRAISPPLRRALARRDGGCRFPGCAAKLCDAHHLEHWADGGETKLGNLVQLCRRHHRAVHEEGFRVELRRDGELRFFRPDGRPLVEAPALPASGTSRGRRSLTASHRAASSSTSEAGLPSWDGTPLDLAWAVDCLARSAPRPRRRRPGRDVASGVGALEPAWCGRRRAM